MEYFTFFSPLTLSCIKLYVQRVSSGGQVSSSSIAKECKRHSFKQSTIHSTYIDWYSITFRVKASFFSHNVSTFTQDDFNCCCICWFIFLYKQDRWYIYTWSLFPFKRGNRSWKRHLHVKYIHKTHSDSVLPGSILYFSFLCSFFF